MFVEYESDVEEESERVQKLLENLRIEAEVLVMHLSKGDLTTYETIINGKPEDNPDVEAVLNGEEWWNELKRRRNKAATPNNILDVVKLVSSSNWPTSSFQQGPKETPEKRLKELRKFIKGKRRQTISGIRQMGLPLSWSITAHKLRPELAFQSDSDSSEDESRSGPSSGAASENDIDDYTDEDEDHNASVTPLPRPRRASTGDALTTPLLRRSSHKNLKQKAISSPLSGAAVSTTNQQTSQANCAHDGHKAKETEPSPLSSAAPTETTPLHKSISRTSISHLRPDLPHRVSSPSFSSSAIPVTQILSDESGPSIGFAPTDTSSTTHAHRGTSGVRNYGSLLSTVEDGPVTGKRTILPTSNVDQSAGVGHPSSAIPITFSFNDLPAKAQHLILNELMRKYSDDTAVLFTTLPSPAEGTSRNEADSLEYLYALEILTDGLPPTLLVHSNSLTVTTAL